LGLGDGQYGKITEKVRFYLTSGLTKRIPNDRNLGKHPLGYKFDRLLKNLEYGSGSRGKIEDKYPTEIER